MIRLHVKNYQAARDIKLDVSGLTLLKGPSNSGKSSFLKAIDAAVNNRFRKGCITFGEKSCSVKIGYPEGIIQVVKELAGSPVMKVKVGDTVQTFSKVGRDVPPEVAALHNFRQIESGVEKLSLNYMDQFSPPLMVQYSNKRIVELLGAGKALVTTNTVRSKIRSRGLELNGELNALETLINNTKESLSATREKLKLFEDIEDVKSLELKINTQEKRLSDLITLQTEIDLLTSYEDDYTELSMIIAQATACLEASNRYDLLRKLSRLNMSDQSADYARAILVTLDALIPIRHRFSLLSELGFILGQRIENTKPLEEIVSLSERLSSISIQQKSVVELSGLLEQSVTELENMDHIVSCIDKAVCPICGTQLVK